MDIKNFNPIDELAILFSAFHEGEIDGIDIYIIKKKLETIIKGIKDHEGINEDAIDLINRGEKSRRGYELGVTNRRRYEYNFKYYWDLKEEYDQKRKALEQISKGLVGKALPSAFVPDPDTGEAMEVKAARVYHSEVINVKSPKI